MTRRSWIVSALVVGCLAAPALAPRSWAQDSEAGRALYDKFCSQCHGVQGDGKGVAASRLKPLPRDLTSGKYKVRTTPSGAMPTDDDLRSIIRKGMPYTSMPAWPNFSEGQLDDLVAYVKSFSSEFQNADKLSPPIDIPQPPKFSEESAQRGRKVYEDQGCVACHGDQGRGDGLSAPTLTDDWGNHIRVADMTQPWTFRGGPTRRDIFRTFSTGLNGTPMPSYGDTLAVEDRWDLVNYIASLADGEQPGYADLLVVPYLEDELDINAGPQLFEGAPQARFPLVGQIMQPGRNFYVNATSVDVRAVYNRREIAFLVSWNDMRAETDGRNSPTLEVPPFEEPADAGGEEGGDFWGDEVEEQADEGGDFWGDEAQDEDEGGDDFWGDDEGAGGGTGAEFSDAVALQFPQQALSGVRKPYFLLGDGESPVELWFVDLARNLPRTYTCRGSESIEPTAGDEIEVLSSYEQGRWSVMFKRSLRSTTSVSFEQGQFVPLAFSVWDGFNEERGNKRALSAWLHLYVEPQQVLSPVGPMVKAGLGVLLVELLVIFFVRRRYAGGGAKAADRSPDGGAYPEVGATS